MAEVVSITAFAKQNAERRDLIVRAVSEMERMAGEALALALNIACLGSLAAWNEQQPVGRLVVPPLEMLETTEDEAVLQLVGASQAAEGAAEVLKTLL